MKRFIQQVVRNAHRLFLNPGLPDKLGLYLHNIEEYEQDGFRLLVDFCRSRGYRFVDPLEFVNGEGRLVFLSFDDNYVGWHEAPILDYLAKKGFWGPKVEPVRPREEPPTQAIETYGRVVEEEEREVPKAARREPTRPVAGELPAAPAAPIALLPAARPTPGDETALVALGHEVSDEGPVGIYEAMAFAGEGRFTEFRCPQAVDFSLNIANASVRLVKKQVIAFNRNVRLTAARRVVNELVMTSEAALEELRAREVRLRLLFVDGAHDEASVRADLRGWVPLVRPGGLVVLLTYSQVLFYAADEVEGAPFAVFNLNARQCEAIAWTASGIVFANEQRDVFRLKISALKPAPAKPK